MIKTNLGRTVSGVDFYRHRLSIWVAIGRTSPWPDEAHPPAEDKTSTTLDELIGLKLINRAAPAIKDEENGTFIYKGENYRILTIEEGYALQATFLFTEFIIETEDFPDIDYRQVGVFVDSIPKEGFINYTALTPNRFVTLGQLVYISNEVVQIRYPSTRHRVQLILPQ